MKLIVQNLANGDVNLEEVPSPGSKPRHLLIQTTHSLLSAGTERMLMQFGKANWLDKARQQPDKVRMVLEKVRTDGIMPTLESVRSKLEQPLPLGYSNVGVVREVGVQVSGIRVGDRVVSNGHHAELVSVPMNLCARIPDNVPDDAATFTVVGAIALQGVRLAQPTLGETFAVFGLGLIGLITVQILRAHGCRVVGIDPNPARQAMATRFGATAAVSADGVDGVLVTAATRSNELMHQAAQMCRKRGRIILVGVAGLELSRDDFYKKELTFQVSCSYGPGRYDPAYEEGGQDYPLGFVRWTEKRNFEAVLELMADGRLDVAPLITHRFAFDEAHRAYELIQGEEPHIGVLLQYAADTTASLSESLKLRTTVLDGGTAVARDSVEVGFIGAGQHALRILLPAFRESGSSLRIVSAGSGLAAKHAARKFGFREATTETQQVLANPSVNTVAIATRHDSHAELVCQSLAAGKNVFVEKPLAIIPAELDRIEALHAELANPAIMLVGFNRRFAPHIVRMKALLDSVPDPKAMVITVNAGKIPSDHWTQDPAIGGGRIVGEACHFIDLARHLTGHPIASVNSQKLSPDSVSINLQFADRSIATIHYLANGNKSFPKERIEVFTGGRILQLDNFRVLRGYGWSGFRTMRLWSQDKGHAAMIAALVAAIRKGGPSPIPFCEIAEVTRATFEAAQ